MAMSKKIKNKAILEPVEEKIVEKKAVTKTCICGYVVNMAKTGLTGCPRCGRLQ